MQQCKNMFYFTKGTWFLKLIINIGWSSCFYPHISSFTMSEGVFPKREKNRRASIDWRHLEFVTEATITKAYQESPWERVEKIFRWNIFEWCSLVSSQNFSNSYFFKYNHQNYLSVQSKYNKNTHPQHDHLSISLNFI